MIKTEYKINVYFVNFKKTNECIYTTRYKPKTAEGVTHIIIYLTMRKS